MTWMIWATPHDSGIINEGVSLVRLNCWKVTTIGVQVEEAKIRKFTSKPIFRNCKTTSMYFNPPAKVVKQRHEGENFSVGDTPNEQYMEKLYSSIFVTGRCIVYFVKCFLWAFQKYRCKLSWSLCDSCTIVGNLCTAILLYYIQVIINTYLYYFYLLVWMR